MTGEDIMKPGFITALLALALSAGAAAAQSANSLKDRIVGSWNFVVAEVTAPDGKKSFPFGDTPKGILIFTADGRFAQIHVAGDVPRIASNNRMTGTPEEYAGIMQRSLSCSAPTPSTRPTRRSPTTSCPPHSRIGKARRRPAPSTSSPPTSSSTPIRAWPEGAAARAIFTGG